MPMVRRNEIRRPGQLYLNSRHALSQAGGGQYLQYLQLRAPPPSTLLDVQGTTTSLNCQGKMAIFTELAENTSQAFFSVKVMQQQPPCYKRTA